MPLSPEEVIVKLAIVEDRQKRYDEVGITVLRQLESIQKDLTLLREDHHEDVERLHDRINAEKKLAHDDIWNAIRRHETQSGEMYREIQTRIDQGRLWLVGALASAIIALLGVLFTSLFNFSHVATTSTSIIPH